MTLPILTDNIIVLLDIIKIIVITNAIMMERRMLTLRGYEDEFLVESHIKPSESTNLVNLGIKEKLMMVASTMFKDEEQELNAKERVTTQELKAKAELNVILENAIKEMRAGNHRSVTIQVASEYIPFIDEVMDPIYGLGRYYDYKTYIRDLPLEIHFFFYMKVSIKEAS